MDELLLRLRLHVMGTVGTRSESQITLVKH